MSRNSDERALEMTAKNEAYKKKIAVLEDKLANKQTIIDDLMYTAKNNKLEHEFEVRDLNAAHVRALATGTIKCDRATQEATLFSNSESVIAQNKFDKMEAEKNHNLAKLRDEISDVEKERKWEIEKACNVVRKDLEGKCIEADLRTVTAEAKADAAEKILNEYKNMIANNKSNVAEKALTEALKVISKAVEPREVHVSNKTEINK